ncbi:PREDICTED: glycerophosphoinositol inositolphosphodiesterase GDPD2 [Cyprinodon variegatus]|uniref:Glycerophosphodiester phosphodiesterase domain containing 2 n=1 Tax=Cyprinodon variegatus TaxID=28743 RepID=A0A3Q2EBK8_CYPVA|nr:PREDICTED: glycerophosphoinositol inositolphosphodiesterase GDPD2 [Cyprinodon variegatus]XP_015242598.1 PREDICTED: glycerophosphoinositol inositolphosphodiesterase GDPD2 [Cyprinodon variegatus]
MSLRTCCRDCSRGFFSCQLKKQSGNTNKRSCCWCTFVSVGALVSICWIYLLIIFNDQYNLNADLFYKFHKHLNYFMVMMTVSAMFASYCVLLLLFALVQVALRVKLHLHWLHRILIFIGVILIALVITVALSLFPHDPWTVAPISFQYTGPFLQFGAVGAWTLLSWFIFQAFHEAKKGSKWIIGLVFVTVSAFIFICPIFIRSPCLIYLEDLENTTKPSLWGHRGAPMLAPENTMMSFERSATVCNVTLFETDVQLSKDGIPFLMHDNKSGFLNRTTNITTLVESGKEWNFNKLRSLNAGEWFIKADPFHTVHLLKEEQKKKAKEEKIPKLSELLELAIKTEIPVMFDLYVRNNSNTTEVDKDAEDIVKTIQNSRIDSRLIYWLNSEKRKRPTNAANFTQVYENEDEMHKENGFRLNVKFSEFSMDKIRDLRKEGVKVNVYVVDRRWLFSLFWCAGVSSVTTNACHVLKEMEQPDWHMSPDVYRTTWISVDVASFMIMIAIFCYQWKKRCSYLNKGIL